MRITANIPAPHEVAADVAAFMGAQVSRTHARCNGANLRGEHIPYTTKSLAHSP